MIGRDRLIQNQVKNFIIESAEKETVIFHDNLNKFLELYKSNDYTNAKDCLNEMRYSAINLNKSINLFNEELFDSCLNIDKDDPYQYKQYIIKLIAEKCVEDIKNNLDILNEPFRPDYYYLNEKYINQRLSEDYMMSNLLFYNRCIFTFITEARALCIKHILFDDINGV